MSTAALEADVSVVLFPVADVIIPEERQRDKAFADEALIVSIEQQGLINPIVIHADGRLVAGERRLDAHIKLSRPFIRATILENLSPIKAFEIELQENLARKQLTWQEEVRAIGKYHAERLAAFPGWTQMGTASALGLSQGHLSTVLAIAEEIEDVDVQNCPTLRGAFNLLTARADRARMAAQSRGLEIAGAVAIALPPAIPANATKEERTAALMAHVDLTKNVNQTVTDIDKSLAAIQQGRIAAAALEQQRKHEIVSDLVLNEDFLNWAASYTGPKFDVIHADFPYGKNYSGARTRKTSVAIAPVYADDPDIYFGLVEGFLKMQDNFCFPAAHCIFWFDMQYYQWTIDQFEAAGWKLVQPFPLIWTKGYSGVASDPKRRPRHCYETALLFSRGDRKIVNLDKDHFECLLDEKLHLNQKPLDMLKHFLNLVVDEHTAVLDPTCGSGSALAAALQLKAARVLGIELDENNADIARFLLQRKAPLTPSNEDNAHDEHAQ